MREFYINEKESQSSIVVMARPNLEALCDHYCPDLLEYSGIFIIIILLPLDEVHTSKPLSKCALHHLFLY